MISTIRVFCLAGLFLVGCGAEDPGNPQPIPVDTWVNQKPILHVYSPGELAVGEQLVVIGQNFIDAGHGQPYITFKGTFFNGEGGTNEVEYTAAATAINAGKLLWDLWPDVVFSNTGDQLGRFVGNLVVSNEGKDGSQEISDPLSLSLEIKPSLIARLVQPMGFGCAPVVEGTVEEMPMQIAVEAIGLREGTEENPLTFKWTFMTEQWDVKVDHGTLDTTSILPEEGPIVLEDVITSGRTSHLEDGGTRRLLLQVWDDIWGDTRLKQLRPKKVEGMGAHRPIPINVAVTDASGKSTTLTIPFTVHQRAEMLYDNSFKIAERFEPILVTDCIPGGDIGRDVTYHESSSESRSRSMGYNWNANIGAQANPLGLVAEPLTWVLGLNASIGFGMNVNDQVTSDKSKSLSIQGHVLPGRFGVFYRQTTQISRVAQLIGYTECGRAIDLGEAILTDWLFTPDFAIDSSCPPPTKLQPAQKFFD